MEAIVTRCGYRCDLCLAYRPNVEANPADREKLSDGWFTYFGFRIPAEQIACDGCMSAEPNPRLLDVDCPVRPCVLDKGLENCSQCEDYLCERLRQRLIEYEAITRQVGGEIPEDDRRCFILPYENKERLDALRNATDR